MLALVLACSLGIGAGLSGIAAVCSSGRSNAAAPKRPPARDRTLKGPRRTRSVATAVVGSAVIALAVTRWPVAAVLAGIAAYGLPSVVSRSETKMLTERAEAVATWTELLRDTMASSAGLSQSILTTAPLAPPAIAGPVTSLAERVANGTPLTEALELFAGELGDPGADMVVSALVLSASAQAQRLTDVLGALSQAIREEVSLRLRVEASRVSARSGVRTVVVFSLVFAGLLAVFAHSYLAPFGSATGQEVLACVGGFYVGGLALMVRLVRPPTPPRLLGPVTR